MENAAEDLEKLANKAKVLSKLDKQDACLNKVTAQLVQNATKVAKEIQIVLEQNQQALSCEADESVKNKLTHLRFYSEYFEIHHQIFMDHGDEQKPLLQKLMTSNSEVNNCSLQQLASHIELHQDIMEQMSDLSDAFNESVSDAKTSTSTLTASIETDIQQKKNAKNKSSANGIRHSDLGDDEPSFGNLLASLAEMAKRRVSDTRERRVITVSAVNSDGESRLIFDFECHGSKIDEDLIEQLREYQWTLTPLISELDKLLGHRNAIRALFSEVKSVVQDVQQVLKDETIRREKQQEVENQIAATDAKLDEKEQQIADMAKQIEVLKHQLQMSGISASEVLSH